MSESSVRWVFQLSKDFTWASGYAVPEDLAFRDGGGTVRLVIRRSGEVTVPAGYAWDGCTPKAFLFDVVIGIPDGVIDTRTLLPKTYYASLVHDAMYQFLLDDLPFKRAQVDRCFARLMEETGFRLRFFYWAAVRLLGWFFVALHRYKRKNRGRAERIAI